MWCRPKTLERENQLLEKKGGPGRETVGVMKGGSCRGKLLVWFGMCSQD